LFNIHTCQYESYLFDHHLLPIDCINALPNVLDYDTTPYYFISSTSTSSETTTNNNNHNTIIHNPYEERWPILFQNNHNHNSTKTRIFLSIGDGACANIGSKCTRMNRIACTIGTSAAARVCIEYPIIIQQRQQSEEEDSNNSTKRNTITNQKIIIPYGLFCYRIDRYHILLGGALTDGGSIIEWIMNHLFAQKNQSIPTSVSSLQSYIHDATQLFSDDYKEYINRKKYNNDNQNHTRSTTNEISSSLQTAVVSEVSKKSSNLIVVPFFSGERNIGYRINSTGAMIGFTLQTRLYHIVKACLEGITLRLYAIIQLIQTTIGPLLEEQQQQHSNDNDSTCMDAASMMILCSGKALEMNLLWRTMIADCTGIPVRMEEQTYEGTSRGVAILIQNALFRTAVRSDICCNGDEEQRLEQIISTSTINGRYIDEDVDDTKSVSTTAMTIQPNPNVKGYWDNLANQQEAIINALTTTLQWS
jgi:gluconokinase